MEVRLDDREFGRVESASLLGGIDVKSENSWDHPDRVRRERDTSRRPTADRSFAFRRLG